jgi:RecG-like helicase
VPPAGYQALLLAPTETLASQHLATLTRIWKGLPAAVHKQGLLKEAPAALTQDALRTVSVAQHV